MEVSVLHGLIFYTEPGSTGHREVYVHPVKYLSDTSWMRFVSALFFLFTLSSLPDRLPYIHLAS